MPVSGADLISIYEIQYKDALEAGKITPLTIPYHFLNFFILVVYIVLSPYETTQRLQFPVLGFIVWHSTSMLLSTRTLNHPYGSIIGLYSIWCIYWSATLIIFNDTKRDLKDRIGWAVDLATTLRGINWSFHFRDKSKIPKPLSNLRQTRSTSFCGCLLRFLLSCACIDVLKLIMMTDPYFWGYARAAAPSHLPPFFHHPAILSAYRSVITTADIKVALHYQCDLNTLISTQLLGPEILGPVGEAWMHPPICGPFSAVLEDGLNGFWGQYWHQIFRIAFTSAGRWVVLQLGLEPGARGARTVVTLVAFLMSSVLHASSTLTLWGETRPWLDVRFFPPQPVGIWLQGLVQGALGQRYREKWEAKWTVNAVTSLLWFWAMMPLLAEDLAAGGVWLSEPIPVSPLRGLGFGTGFGMPKKWWCWRGQWFSWNEHD